MLFLKTFKDDISHITHYQAVLHKIGDTKLVDLIAISLLRAPGHHTLHDTVNYANYSSM